MLIADDHAPFARTVSALLRSRFEVVAAVGDGVMALDAAAKLDPDIVLLDISMPQLDGIRTAKQLRQVGSRAAIVFLTMHQDDDYISAALAAGALGYVFKSRLSSDLTAALDLALAGYRFISPHAFANLDGANNGGSRPKRWLDHTRPGHFVRFHSDDDQLVAGWAEFLGTAIEANATAVVVGTAAHREQLERRLNARGLNLPAAVESGRYLELDADHILSSAMVGGELDANLLTQVLDEAVRQARVSTQNDDRRVVFAAEVAPSIWLRGNPETALWIEQLASNWVATNCASIFCSYPLQCFGRKCDRELLLHLCAAHNMVVPSRT